MEHFLINSSVCLFVLWLAYKLLLENTSWHAFNRWFLIASLIISLCIPFIVVETIVIPIVEIPFVDDSNLIIEDAIIEETSFEINWFYVGSGIYILGVMIMLWRFTKNLNSFRIQQEDEISSYKTYQLILRNQITIPHSFLKRIFVSKKDHGDNKIPSVVLEHEKAHLDQKHSLDILFIESLIVLLWFNPLLYLIRYSMKLNHEFLADRVVLNQGVSTKVYQQLLLDHATTSYQQAMANTFTFPIIKKRFHIMKTHTSNTSLVLRSLAIIPILALLIISCGKEETEFIEIEEIIIEEQPTNRKIIVVDPSDPKGNITINGEPHFYKIKGEKIEIYDQNGELQDFESQGYEVVKTDEFIEVLEVLENLAPEDITTYNQLAKKHEKYMKLNDQLIVWKNETKHMQTIYNSMNEEQRAENEPWPFTGTHYGVKYKPGQIPPPPPPAAPTKSPGYIKVDEKIYRYTLKENDNNFYDRNGNIIDVKGKTVEYIKKEDLPPPPPPADPLDYIKDKGDNMNYYIDDVKVNAAKAKAFIKKNGKKGIEIGPVDGVNSLRMYSKPNDKRVGINGGNWEDVETILEKGTANSRESVVDKGRIYLNGKQITMEQYEKIKDGKSITSLEVKKINGENHTYMSTISLESQPAPNSKKEPTSLSIRKAFLMAALRQQKPVKFEINLKQATLAEVETLIKNNNEIPFDLITQNGNEHTLAFFDDSSVKMSKETLNKMYSKFFQTIDPKKNESSFILSKSNKKVGSITTPQKKLILIGDPIDVINMNREKFQYYVDGKVVNYEDAMRVILKNENCNISMDQIKGKKSMIIDTYQVGYGPVILEERDC